MPEEIPEPTPEGANGARRCMSLAGAGQDVDPGSRVPGHAAAAAAATAPLPPW